MSWAEWLQGAKAEEQADAEARWRREQAGKLIEERTRRGAAAARQVHTLEDGGAIPSAATTIAHRDGTLAADSGAEVATELTPAQEAAITCYWAADNPWQAKVARALMLLAGMDDPAA